MWGGGVGRWEEFKLQNTYLIDGGTRLHLLGWGGGGGGIHTLTGMGYTHFQWIYYLAPYTALGGQGVFRCLMSLVSCYQQV